MNDIADLKPGLPYSDRLILAIDAGLLAFFGAVLVVAPAPMMSVFGATLTPDGASLMKLLGGCMLGFAMLNWIACRARSYRMAVGALASNLVRTAVCAFVSIEYTLHHNSDSGAVLVTAMFVVFAGAYAVLFIRRRRLIGDRSVGTLTSEEWF